MQELICFSSVERYYGTVIIIDYQLQIPLNFSNTVKTEYPLKHATIIFILFVRNFIAQPRVGSWLLLCLWKRTRSTMSAVSTYHSETETDEPSEETTDSTQGGMQLISKKNTKSLVWKYFGFTPGEDGRPTNYCNQKCKLCFKEVSAKFSNTSNLLKHLRLHHRNEYSEITRAQTAEPRSVKSSGKDKSTQPTLQACLQQSRKYSTNSKEHRRLSNAVTNFIV